MISFCLIQGVVASFFESLGLCLFSIVVVGTMKNFIYSILLMNGIFIFPVAYQVFREIRKIIQRSRDATPMDMYQAFPQFRAETGSLSSEYQDEKYNWLTLVRFVVSTAMSLGGFIFIIYAVSCFIK